MQTAINSILDIVSVHIKYIYYLTKNIVTFVVYQQTFTSS